jgi:hypothetical protein
VKGLAQLRAEVDSGPHAAPRKILVNAEQRLNVIGGGKAVATWNAVPVARHNIEAAAREGYLDALAGKGFSRQYDDAPPPWQRNYEIGRLWGAGMIACGIEPPGWPDTATRQPNEITLAVAEVGRRIGALRPEMEGIQAPRDDLPTLHTIAPPRRRRMSR